MHSKTHYGQNVEAMAHRRLKKFEEEVKEKTTLAKVDDKANEKANGSGKAKDEKSKKKRLKCVTIAESRGTLKKSVERKILHKCLRNFERRKQKMQERQLKKSIFYQLLMYTTTSVFSVLTLKLLMYQPQSHLL